MPEATPPKITVLVREEGNGSFGLKIPGYEVEVYGEDLPSLIEMAEEYFWWRVEERGEELPEGAVFNVTMVTHEEFGPTCYELAAEEAALDWVDDEDED
ncbi:MAG: hypothetical protein U0790_04145 [Isosphaeraceae bacterium]